MNIDFSDPADISYAIFLIIAILCPLVSILLILYLIKAKKGNTK